MNLTPLLQYLPQDDPVKAMIYLFGGILVVFLVLAFTIQPVIVWVVSKPAEWIARGRPVLPATTESRPVYTPDELNSL